MSKNMEQEALHKAALSLTEKYGVKIFPVEANKKIPTVSGWQKIATQDAGELILLLDAYPGCNIGVATGEYEPNRYLVVLDVDEKNNKHGEGSLAALEQELGELPPTFTVRTTSGGRHLYFWSAEPVGNSVGKLGDGLDVRGCGGFVVAPGSVINGKTYEIESDAEIAWLPGRYIGRMGLSQPKTKVKQVIEETDTPAILQRATDYLIKDAPEALQGSGGDHTTFTVAARLKDMGVSEPMALELMLDHWNETKAFPLWEPEELVVKVANAYAYGKNPIGSSAPEAAFTPIASAQRKGLPLEFFSDIRLSGDGVYLVEGVLPVEGFTVVYGKSGAGKTHFVLSLALAVASGNNWWGTKEVLKKPVLYIAAEGAHGLRGRVLASKKALSLDKSDVQFALLSSSIDMHSPHGWCVVQDCIERMESTFGARPGLVIIDTLARTISPGDENSAKDMGLFIQNCEALRRTYCGQLLVIHHAGKNDQNGARGHSSLRAAVETEIKIEKGKAVIAKQRDGEDGETFCWKLSDPIIIGQDKAQKDITSVVPIPISAKSAQAQKAFSLQRPKKGTHASNALLGLEALIALHREKDNEATDRVPVSEWLAQEWASQGMGEPRKVFYQVKKLLLRKGLIFLEGDMVGLVELRAEGAEKDVFQKPEAGAIF